MISKYSDLAACQVNRASMSQRTQRIIETIDEGVAGSVRLTLNSILEKIWQMVLYSG